MDQQSFRKLLSRNVGLPLGVGLLGAVAFVAVISYLLSAMQWVEHTDRVIGNANETLKLSIDMETGMRGFLITGDERFLDPYEVAKPRIFASLDSLRDLVADNPAQVDRIDRLSALQHAWNDFGQEMITLRRTQGGFQQAITNGRGKRITDEVRKEFDDFIGNEQQLRQVRNQTVNTVTVTAITTFVLFIVALSGLLAYLGRRDLLALSDSYVSNMQAQQRANERLEHNAWLRNGQTQLAEQVLGQLTLPMLGDNILKFFATYLGSVVGALYVRNEHGSLVRVASYGLSAAEQLRTQALGVDEGLVSEAVRQSRVVRLDQLPEDYFRLSSGLGSGLPRSALLMPTRDNGQINGVVELGFLRPLSERDQEIVERVAENLGMSIESARYRQRLQEVLAETQQLNEELQVQQEELKTANEELEEQSRVLKESQAHLETQQAELEQTNESLSERTEALDRKNSELNEAQQELQARAEDLQRSSKYKSEFLANMSHELRTPLNSSLILAKLLAENDEGNLTAEQVKFADSIYSAGNDLLNLINDILDIAKVEAGKLEVRPETTQVERLVEGLRSMFVPLAKDKGLDFQVVLEHPLPATLFTDRQRLEQILKNLLSNAVKFTDTGRVSLTVSANADGWVQFEVQDSGIGIAPEQQDKIFDAFHQADGSTARKYGGTGLGLSISRDLTALLGGTLTLTSAPGEGSTFVLSLPRNGTVAATPPVLPPAQPPVRAPVPEPEPVAPAQGLALPAFADDRAQPAAGVRTVLVVEDEPEFARILYGLAHDMEFRCLVALTAQEGLELATNESPDAILLDIRLPDGSGLSVLQQLKDNPGTRHIPVHVVSSQENGGEALHLGAIGYALKPTSREQLEDVFRKLKDKSSQEMKRVLLVEDDERQRDSVVQLISDTDVEIAAVGSGTEALDLLRTQTFDCMIIDLKLPDMQGNELLKRMSLEELCSFPPVIVYTGRNLTRDEEAELLKYSRSIIIKGARSPERLLDEVTLFLHKVESELSSERQSMLKTVRGRDRVFEGRTILLVDDDVRNVFALTSALEQRGARVEVGRNGYEAIAKLDEHESIDLVLMDVMMPGMDGLEATRRIRQDKRFARLPIIAITAKAMKDDQEQCLAAGANDYLAKPIDLTRLYSLLRVWMPTLERI